jgi:Fic family protein
MLYATPVPDRSLRASLDELDRLRVTLGREVANPSPWLGTLRRQAMVSSITSSVSIEGFTVPADEADAIVSRGTADASDDNRKAVACYAHAMDHVGVMALDPVFDWTDRVILDLHFDACSFQRDRSPGRWRTDPIGVTAPGGGLAYEGPDGDEVVRLMAEVVGWLQAGDRDSHAVVRAAMAHLHTVSVHPFRDGNGRISRIVQSLVLARDGLLAPEFSSIEEYLAEHTSEYYAALQAVQGGRYQPERDALEWVRFCVEAHLAQAGRRLAQVAAAGERWARLEALVGKRGWPERIVIALEQSLHDGTDRASYGQEAGVSTATASTDLRRLVDAGLIVARGRGRVVRYHATETLTQHVEG